MTSDYYKNRAKIVIGLKDTKMMNLLKLND